MTGRGEGARHWAEGVARRHLEGLGWRILEANFAARGGEIDLVAMDGGTVVFVEVRQRRSDRYGHPAETIDRRKLGRLERTARLFLSQRFGADVPARFDAVLVLGDERRHRLTHLRDVL